MKQKTNPLHLIYLFLVVYPLGFSMTALMSLLSIVCFAIAPDTKFSYFPARFWARFICFIALIRVKNRGLEKLSTNQSYVFMMNHQSWFDIFAVYGWLPHFFKWIMKAELGKAPFLGWACRSAGHIFVDRRNPKEAQASLEKAKENLKNGISVVIFPEGTRTFDGSLGSFKRGGFKIATDLGLPIVPVTIKGSFERMKRSSTIIRPGEIEMIFHDPIDTTAYPPERMTELMEKTREQIKSSLKD